MVGVKRRSGVNRTCWPCKFTPTKGSPELVKWTPISGWPKHTLSRWAHTSWGSIHVPISERTPLRELCHATKMGVISFPLGDAGGFSFLSLGPTLRNSHLDSHGLKPIITYLTVNNWEAKLPADEDDGADAGLDLHS